MDPSHPQDKEVKMTVHCGRVVVGAIDRRQGVQLDERIGRERARGGLVAALMRSRPFRTQIAAGVNPVKRGG
jgi:hypothetical protein